MGCGAAVVLMGLVVGADRGDAIVVRLPVNEQGAIDGGEFLVKLAKAVGCTIERPHVRVAIPVRGPIGLVARSFLAQALGPDVAIRVGAKEVVVRVRCGDADDPGRPGLRARLAKFARDTRFFPAGPAPRYGFQGRKSYRPNAEDRPTICLIHGINSTSESFVHLIPALEAEGFGVVVYNYPYERDLDEMVEIFAREWREFRVERGERKSWAVLTHSMGVLLARDYVEGDHYRDDVSHLFLIGPTNQGAAVARAQKLLRLARKLHPADEAKDEAPAEIGDDVGAAAEDLLPGSKFLERLNRRPRRQGVSYHTLAGSEGFLSRSARASLETSLASASDRGGLLGGLSRLAAAEVGPALDELTAGTGDGCVSIASTRLDGVTDHVTIPANHVELIRGPLLYPDPGPIACLPFVLKRMRAGADQAGR